ncbi:MAG: cation transporter dimerization domain-containing protein [Bacteroidales bacterium]
MLLDRVSPEIQEKVENQINHVTEITNYHDLKIRSSGADTFVEVCINVKPGLSIDEAHEISHHVSDEIKKKVDRVHVHIHTEPETSTDFTNLITNN